MLWDGFKHTISLLAMPLNNIYCFIYAPVVVINRLDTVQEKFNA